MLKDKKVKTMSEKIKKRDERIKILRIGLLICVLFLIICYFILSIIYEQGGFTVTLDRDLAQERGIVIYESLEDKNEKIVLTAEKKENMDNITKAWLPANIKDEADGAHNGDNYLAYTFYAENKSTRDAEYWYSIIIDDVIRDVDKAIRVMIYENDEETVYAKANNSGNAEENTTKFYDDNTVVVKQRKNMKPGDIDKYTVVIWIEGNDPDCVDYLIGGEIKMHMELMEEYVYDNQ